MERYEKIRVIGQGAFGKVFLVRYKRDDRPAVIKQIPIEDLNTEERISATNEVKVLAMLTHPNITAYYDNFLEEKNLMIVMEYAPGGTLHEFIQNRNGHLMDEDHILQFFVQLLVAIDHVHSLNILHRDLKTQNVMMNRRRTVLKIGDFGISKILSTKITSAQTVVGTPCYISPEICEGRQYAKKSDVWALGCVLYEMTTLKRAFEGPNLPALVLKIMQGSATLSPIDPTYSRGLNDLIYSLLQRNPEDRPNIHNIMAMPVVVNAHMNLATDVGRLPCTARSTSDTSVGGAVGGVKPHPPSTTYTRMGSLGKCRQRSFFEDSYQPESFEQGGATVTQKPDLYMWGGNTSLPMKLDTPSEGTDSHLVSVACGRVQRLGITKQGKLYSWKPEMGSLATTWLTTMRGGGRKREPLVLVPNLLPALKSMVIKKVACGDMFTACLTDKGVLLTFGSGVNGCLGHGDYNDVEEPKLVHHMLEFETSEVACGSYHVIAITADGQVYSWGKGGSGQLGLGSHGDQYIPQRILFPSDSAPLSASCGSDCSMIVTEDGQLYATGCNRHNKLALDRSVSMETSSSDRTLEPELSHTPKLANIPHMKHVVSDGSLQQIDESNLLSTPAILKAFKDVPLGSSLVLSSLRAKKKAQGEEDGFNSEDLLFKSDVSLSGGSVVDRCGLLGNERGSHDSSVGRVEEVCEFTLCGSELVRNRRIVGVSTGVNHTAIVTATGECITCGDNAYGQLGYSRVEPSSASLVDDDVGDRNPAVVEGLIGRGVEKITCGDFFTIACCKSGEVYSWGKGGRGRLGRETDKDTINPQQILFEHSSQRVQSLDCSHGTTLLLTVPQL